MIQKSVQNNFILNALRVGIGILFPVIVFPYASRILLPEGTGKVDFAIAIITYFVMLSSLGIPLYGIRECSKVRDNKEQLSKLAHELFIINLFSTLISYIIFFICIFNIPKFENNKLLLIFCSINIIFTTLGIDWLYQALEEYKYITIRSLACKFIGLIALFVLVHTKDDYMFYAGIVIFSNVGSNILNTINARKYISFKLFKTYEFKKHFKPILIIFSMSLAISIYGNLDTIMLGFMKTDTEVGLYNAAIKMSRVVITLITSLGTVLLPRMSYYIKQNNTLEFQKLIDKSSQFLILVSFPCIVFLYIYSKEIIQIFAGNSYTDAYIAMKILLPIIPLIAISNLIGIQILIPLKKEKYTLYSVIAGAILNFVANLILIPKYSFVGASIGCVLAEFIVTLIQIVFALEYTKKALFSIQILRYIVLSIIMSIVIIPINIIFHNVYIELIMAFVVYSILYMFILYCAKDTITKDIINKINSIIFRKSKKPI